MPDTSTDGGSFYDKIKGAIPFVVDAAIGGALGGPAGAVAGFGGAGKAEVKEQELQEQRASRMNDVLLQVQQRREAAKMRADEAGERLAAQKQQQQFIDTMRARDQQDKQQWQSFQRTEAQLRDQDRHESIVERGQEHAEHEEDVKLSRDNLEAWRNSTGADRTRRTDAMIRRSDAQVKRLGLLNDALVGEKADYDSYVKELPDNLQKEAAAFSHTPSARTAFMKEMQKREQAEDPVRRDALISHAASLLGKTPDDLKEEWAGYSGKKIADLTGNLDLYKAKNGTVGADGLTKAEKAVAAQESGMAKDIRSLSDKYDKQIGVVTKMLGRAPNKTDWIMKQLASTSTFAQTPEQQARAKRAVSMFTNEKVPLSDAVKMVYGDMGLKDKESAPTAGLPEGAPPPPKGFRVVGSPSGASTADVRSGSL
jgi:hypothetical protein